VSPGFEDIVGDDAEATPEELAGLRHVHELLLTASPPPTLTRRLRRPPRAPRRTPLPRGRMRGVLLVAATAVAAAAFGIGYGLGHGGGFQTSFSATMHGVGRLSAASAWIGVGHQDASGTWPLEMTVHGLPKLPGNAWYELYLTRRGKPDVLCGIFRTGTAPVTKVQLNAPSDLDEYTGWVVTRAGAGHGRRVLLTT
jgi:hypothetical protein